MECFPGMKCVSPDRLLSEQLSSGEPTQPLAPPNRAPSRRDSLGESYKEKTLLTRLRTYSLRRGLATFERAKVAVFGVDQPSGLHPHHAGTFRY